MALCDLLTVLFPAPGKSNEHFMDVDLFFIDTSLNLLRLSGSVL